MAGLIAVPHVVEATCTGVPPLVPPPLAPPSEPVATTAVTRGWRHIDPTQWVGLLAGMSVAHSALFHPLYLSIARQQVARQSITTAASAKGVYAQRGLAGLYAGLPITLVGNLIVEVAYLGILEVGREALPITSAAARDAASGTMADGITTPVYMPFGVVSNRQMTAGIGVSGETVYRGAIGTARDVVRSEGYRGLFAGTCATMLTIPTAGAWWCLYSKIKEGVYGALGTYGAAPTSCRGNAHQTGSRRDRLYGSLTSTTDNPVANALAASVTSGVTMFLTNPLTVIRTRLMVQTNIPRDVRWRALWVAKDLVAHEGYKGFYKGTVANCSISVLVGGIFGVVYEGSKEMSDKSCRKAAHESM